MDRLRHTIAIAALASSLISLEAQSTPVIGVAVVGNATSEDEQKARLAIKSALARRQMTLAADEVEELLFRSAPPPAPSPELGAGKRALKRASRAFNSFKLDEAREALETAAQALASWTGTPEARDLVRERLVLAVSLAHAGRNVEQIERALAEYARAFPNEPPPKDAPWPPAIASKLAKLQPSLDASIAVQSKPSGVVYVDGKEIGNAPAVAEGLSSGEHRVIVEAPAHFRGDQRLTLVSGRRTELTIELVPDLSMRLRRMSAERSPSNDIATAMRSLARSRGIDHIILVELSASGGLSLRRFDVNERAPSNIERVSTTNRSDKEIDLALRQLLESEAALSAEAPPPEVNGDSSGVPLWAWIGLGAGAVALSMGTAFRIDAASMQGDLVARQDAITQVDAFAMRDDVDAQAFRGTLLVGVGVAALVGVGGFVAYRVFGSEP
jgi:hypothetical protein